METENSLFDQSAFTKQQAASLQNHPQADLDLWYPTLGHGFHIQHRDPGALPIEGPAHDGGRTVVCAEHPYTGRPTNPFSQGRNKLLQLSLQRSPHCTPERHLLTLLQMPEHRRLRRYLPNDLPTRFMV
jgi:hypothetical protein